MPKLVVVSQESGSKTATMVYRVSGNYPVGFGSASSSDQNTVSWGENFISWYHPGSADKQLNRSDAKFWYFAIS